MASGAVGAAVSVVGRWRLEHTRSASRWRNTWTVGWAKFDAGPAQNQMLNEFPITRLIQICKIRKAYL
jgi:hypothetical protein